MLSFIARILARMSRMAGEPPVRRASPSHAGLGAAKAYRAPRGVDPLASRVYHPGPLRPLLGVTRMAVSDLKNKGLEALKRKRYELAENLRRFAQEC